MPLSRAGRAKKNFFKEFLNRGRFLRGEFAAGRRFFAVGRGLRGLCVSASRCGLSCLACIFFVFVLSLITKKFFVARRSPLRFGASLSAGQILRVSAGVPAETRSLCPAERPLASPPRTAKTARRRSLPARKKRPLFKNSLKKFFFALPARLNGTSRAGRALRSYL